MDDRKNGMKLYETVVTFTQDIKTIESLESFYKKNEQDFFAKLKAMSPSYYKLAIQHMSNMRKRIKEKKKYFVDVRITWTEQVEGESEEEVIKTTQSLFSTNHSLPISEKQIKILGEVE
tara:strand:- start:503 stop:859 length:357 start_codon:yes stop_codon:yes gene_type:complete